LEEADKLNAQTAKQDLKNEDSKAKKAHADPARERSMRRNEAR
jgi:hypothetical protein